MKLPARPACSFCASIDGYIEIEYAADEPDDRPSFPRAFDSLVAPVEKLYADSRLLQCPACTFFFEHLQWTPGGSDDAMRTYVHEAVWPARYLDVHIILRESEEVIEGWYRESPEVWSDAYAEHQAKTGRVLNWLRAERYVEVVRDAVEKFRHGSSPARTDARFRERVQKATARVAWILHGYLLSKAAALDDDLLLELAGLMAYPHETVRDRLGAGLSIGLAELKNQPARLEKIAAALRAISPATPESEKLREAVEEYLEGDLPWREFYDGPGIRLIDSRPFDDALKRHLERLPGLVVTDYIPEGLTEAIIDFKYNGFRFRADNGMVGWSFEVRGDPPANVLKELERHLEELFGK